MLAGGVIAVAAVGRKNEAPNASFAQRYPRLGDNQPRLFAKSADTATLGSGSEK